MRYMPDNNLSYPVLIELGDNSSGSGFYLNVDDKEFYFITALHVLYKKENNINILRSEKAKFTSYDKNLELEDPIIVETSTLSQLEIIKDDKIDIAIIKIGSSKLDDKGRKSIDLDKNIKKITQTDSTIVTVAKSSLRKFSDVLISNEVFVLGYPNSLSFSDKPQIDYKKPLLRKGIIAGKNKIKETIILDCPVYFGNSGGIVIEVEEEGLVKNFKIIGVVSEFVPFVENFKSVQMGYINSSIENSGYSVVVPIDIIINLISKSK